MAITGCCEFHLYKECFEKEIKETTIIKKKIKTKKPNKTNKIIKFGR